MIAPPDTEMLMPIIFACDETKASNQGKASLWPLIFTTSILNLTMRNKPSAWHLLGYIPDLRLNTSINEEKQFGMELKSIRLHQVLKTILKTFVEFQRKEQMDPVSITLGNITKKVLIKAPCFFIIGDMQGGDKMACSSPCYSNKINRLCRKCDVQGQDSGNPNIKCKNIKMKKIQDMVEQDDTEQLKALNQYNVQNAWFDVDFGGCPYGIFSAACPVEPLHALENGLITECIKVLFSKIVSLKNFLN